MRRNVRRHADGDAAGAVDQQIGETRRQNRRLVLLAVVIGLEVDGAFVKIFEQRERRLCEPGLGVAHRRRRIVVDRSEIALPVDERQPHRKGLRHAHKRVVDRRVAMRMIFTHHVADDARRLHIGLIGRVAVLVHREQNAPMHGLQPVTHVRQRARHDHAHRVIEIAALHLVGDRNRPYVRAGLVGIVFLGVVVGQVSASSRIASSSHVYRRFERATPALSAL